MTCPIKSMTELFKIVEITPRPSEKEKADILRLPHVRQVTAQGDQAWVLYCSLDYKEDDILEAIRPWGFIKKTARIARKKEPKALTPEQTEISEFCENFGRVVFKFYVDQGKIKDDGMVLKNCMDKTRIFWVNIASVLGEKDIDKLTEGSKMSREMTEFHKEELGYSLLNRSPKWLARFVANHFDSFDAFKGFVLSKAPKCPLWGLFGDPLLSVLK